MPERRPHVAAQTTVDSASSRRPQSGEESVVVLVLAWSGHEPRRAGEIALLSGPGSRLVLGRGDTNGGDGDAPATDVRLRWFQQRPTGMVLGGPLLSPSLSRRQLVFHFSSEGGVRVERVGRSPLFVNGARTDDAAVQGGDVLRVGRDLVLLVTRRPALLSPLRLFPKVAARAFGEPDAHGVLGESPAIWRVRESLAFAAKSETHVLVLGESGSGKELAARSIHLLSSRASRPFVARSAATLPAGLIDAELFGNARNYPNPGMPDRAGLIGEADGGTLFLDEIGELPAELQSHLLRVLDRDGEYQRLGETAVRRSTFRLVAATNRDASALKHDFLARLAVRVELPRLADRREDIPLLARGLLLRAARRSPEIVARFIVEAADGRANPKLDPLLVEHLVRRDYPTNVRDLDAELWRALAASSASDTDEIALPDAGGRASPAPHRTDRSAAPISAPTSRPEPSLDEIRTALAAQANNVSRAAKALGLSSRFALYRLLKKHGIDLGTGDPDGG